MKKHNSKLNNIKTNGCDSRREFRRLLQLQLMQKAGQIYDLQTQVRFELVPPIYKYEARISPKTGKRLKDKKVCIERGMSYVADFVYVDAKSGEKIVEDAKGVKSGCTYALFVAKRKLMLLIHGLRVYEI